MSEKSHQAEKLLAVLSILGINAGAFHTIPAKFPGPMPID
jgi:hypothetical protein